MTMTHEELVAKRNAIKAKGNWDSTKPFDGPKYVAIKYEYKLIGADNLRSLQSGINHNINHLGYELDGNTYFDKKTNQHYQSVKRVVKSK